VAELTRAVGAQGDPPEMVDADEVGVEVRGSQPRHAAELLVERQGGHAGVLRGQRRELPQEEVAQRVRAQGMHLPAASLPKQPSEQLVAALGVRRQALPQRVHLRDAQPVRPIKSPIREREVKFSRLSI